MKMDIIKALLLIISILVLLNTSLTEVRAQDTLKVSPKIQSTTSASPIQTRDQNTILMQERLSRVESQLGQVSQDSKLTSKVETLINLLSLFSTVLLGTFAGIGGLLVWNGFEMRKQAKEDLAEIKRFKTESAELFTNFQKVADETVNNADKSVKLLTTLVTQADEHSKSIEDKDKQLQNIVSEWESRKTLYSNASQGTATYFETPLPQQSLLSAARRFLKDKDKEEERTASLDDLLTGSSRKKEP